MDIALQFLFVLILLSLVSSFKAEKYFNALDDETKLKIFKVNIITRRITNILFLITIVILYAILKLTTIDIAIAFSVAFILIAIVMGFITYEKSLKIGISKAYLKRILIVRLLACFVVCLVFIVYLTDIFSTNLLESEDFNIKKYEYKNKAQTHMVHNEYKSALMYYTKVIEIDSSDGASYSNRGVCKYYLNDISGACKDWKRAKYLGEKTADTNLQYFCK